MDDLEKYRNLLNHGEDDNPKEDSMSEFLALTGEAKIPNGRSKEEIWDQIALATSKETDSRATDSTPKRINPWIFSGVAAAVLIVVVFILTLESSTTSETVHIVSESGSKVDHKLPDGSVAMMNAASSIIYNEKWNRIVRLSGEAFFEVTEGEKFTVVTSYGSVEVLGTSFNVFARNDMFTVSCKTGKVRVSIPERGLEEELSPGDEIVLEMDTVLLKNINAAAIGNWKTGEFYFSDRRISDVLAEVERQYKTEIQLISGDTLKFTGYFFSNASIENTLDLICLPLGLTFEKVNDGYTIGIENNEL